MEANTMETIILQWHPAFFAGMQVELQWERRQLLFENEHQLGTKPKEIDVLIIKKDPNISIRKNIGQIFKKHNIVEFKRMGLKVRNDAEFRSVKSPHQLHKHIHHI